MADLDDLKILGAKAKQVRDLTKMDFGTPEFLREDIVDASP